MDAYFPPQVYTQKYDRSHKSRNKQGYHYYRCFQEEEDNAADASQNNCQCVDLVSLPANTDRDTIYLLAANKVDDSQVGG